MIPVFLKGSVSSVVKPWPKSNTLLELECPLLQIFSPLLSPVSRLLVRFFSLWETLYQDTQLQARVIAAEDSNLSGVLL